MRTDQSAEFGKLIQVTPLRGFQTSFGPLWIKDETKQRSGAFKIRGSANKLLGVRQSTRVVTASTGNHAIGLATVARDLGLTADVFVPRSTPRAKIQQLHALGANIFATEGQYEDVADRAAAHSVATGATMVHSFDDPDIIAGHRTLFEELLEQLGRPPDHLFVPVGGGGLLAAAIYSTQLTHIFAAEYDRMPKLASRFNTPHGLPASSVLPTSIEGIAVRKLGSEAIKAARTCPRLTVVPVTLNELVDAARLAWSQLGIRAELAAVAGLAAALKTFGSSNASGCKACVITGGNIDIEAFDTLMEAK